MSILQHSKGATFNYVFDIPDTIANGFFRKWKATAQIRKANNNLPSGMIAQLQCYWTNESTTKQLVLSHDLTDNWPVGLAEFDVLFESVDGQSMRSSIMPVQIVRGVTQR